MRFVANISNDVIANIENSDTSVETALQEVSTGQKVNQPSDDPAAAAAMVELQAQGANIDQYTSNTESVLSQAQDADSVLTSVVSLLNQAITLGTEGANTYEAASDRDSIASQVSGLLSSVVSLANTTYQGISLFGGTVNGTAFTADSSSSTGYTYNGNSSVNTVQVGASLSVQANIPGDTLFTASGSSVLGALSDLATALKTGTSAQIGSATTEITTALNYVSDQHAVYGNTINQLQSQETYLASDTVSLSTTETSLIGIDTATAAEDLTQAETDNNAVLSASAKVLQNTLLTYLPN
jgi:flagellar hook-associated protein 3 FlgL